MSRYRLDVFVPGIPVAKGSTHAFKHPTTGAIITQQTNAKKQKPWAACIALAVKQKWEGGLARGAVILSMLFIFPRPKKHYGTGRNADKLKASAPHTKTSRPDLDKLIRCVYDALTGVVWKDDSQVVESWERKVYGDEPGVQIRILDAAAGEPREETP